MTTDDAVMLARFDDYLDDVFADRGADAEGLEAAMVDTVLLVKSAVTSVSPRPAFGDGLRRSLVQQAKATPVSVRASEPLTRMPSPAVESLSTRRWLPRFALAAMLLAVLAMAGVLGNGSGYRSWRSGTGIEDGRTIPGYSAASPVPTGWADREPVAILFVADVSGSMSYDPLGGTPRIASLKEALTQAAGQLADGDEIGVLAFNDRQHWIVPITAIGGQETRVQIDAAIDGMSAEGGTEMFPALQTAFDGIAHSRATRRHVILLSDGKSRTGTVEDYQALVAGAVASGVTLSTIAIGSDADASLLPILATTGRGRHHVASESSEIPAVTLTEVGHVTGRQPTSALATPSADTALAPRFQAGGTDFATEPRVARREAPSFEAQTIAMPIEGTPPLTPTH